MQLSRTLPRVPDDLFRVKKEKMQERVSQSRPQSNNKTPTKRQTKLMNARNSEATVPLKRLRVMTARMNDSGAQLQMLRQSLTLARAEASVL